MKYLIDLKSILHHIFKIPILKNQNSFLLPFTQAIIYIYINYYMYINYIYFISSS